MASFTTKQVLAYIQSETTTTLYLRVQIIGLNRVVYHKVRVSKAQQAVDVVLE